MELLGTAIRQNKDIKGLKIGNVEVKAGQYADDLWSALQPNSINVNHLLDEIDRFGLFSGLRLNYEKCCILHIGPFKNSDAKFYTKKKLFGHQRRYG